MPRGVSTQRVHHHQPIYRGPQRNAPYSQRKFEEFRAAERHPVRHLNRIDTVNRHDWSTLAQTIVLLGCLGIVCVPTLAAAQNTRSLIGNQTETLLNSTCSDASQALQTHGVIVPTRSELCPGYSPSQALTVLDHRLGVEYAQALHKAREFKPENPIPLLPLPSKGTVQLATWTTRASPTFEKCLNSSQTCTVTLERTLWLTSAKEIRQQCQKWNLEGEELNMRNRQLIGLPPTGRAKDTFVIVDVNTSLVERPCFHVDESNPKQPFCTLDVPPLQERTPTQNFVCSHIEEQQDVVPFTAYGCTGDWGNDDFGCGVSEFIVRTGNVTVTGNFSTDEFCAKDVVIIGGGISAMTAGTHLAQANINVLILDDPASEGTLIRSTKVTNWPGELEISGATLYQKLRAQAIHNGVEWHEEKVISVELDRSPFRITTSLQSYNARICIIATGLAQRALNIPGEENYLGRGIFDSVREMPFENIEGAEVAIVGKGGSVITEAQSLLQSTAKKIYLVVPDHQLNISDEKMKEIIERDPRVEILYQQTVEEISRNQDALISLILKSQEDRSSSQLNVAAVVRADTGPNSSLFKGQLQLSARGHIQRNETTLETKTPRVYAIGAVAEGGKAVISAGQGAMAAQHIVSNRRRIFDPRLYVRPPERGYGLGLGSAVIFKTASWISDPLTGSVSRVISASRQSLFGLNPSDYYLYDEF